MRLVRGDGAEMGIGKGGLIEIRESCRDLKDNGVPIKDRDRWKRTREA